MSKFGGSGSWTIAAPAKPFWKYTWHQYTLAPAFTCRIPNRVCTSHMEKRRNAIFCLAYFIVPCLLQFHPLVEKPEMKQWVHWTISNLSPDKASRNFLSVNEGANSTCPYFCLTDAITVFLAPTGVSQVFVLAL